MPTNAESQPFICLNEVIFIASNSTALFNRYTYFSLLKFQPVALEA